MHTTAITATSRPYSRSDAPTSARGRDAIQAVTKAAVVDIWGPHFTLVVVARLAGPLSVPSPHSALPEPLSARFSSSSPRSGRAGTTVTIRSTVRPARAAPVASAAARPPPAWLACPAWRSTVQPADVSSIGGSCSGGAPQRSVAAATSPTAELPVPPPRGYLNPLPDRSAQGRRFGRPRRGARALRPATDRDRRDGHGYAPHRASDQ